MVGAQLAEVGSMGITIVVVVCIGIASLLYATAGQAGGTAFLAVMTLAASPAPEMRPTALVLNILAGGYSTWRLHRASAVDWPLFATLALPAIPAAFLGGLIVLSARLYFLLTGLLLIVAAIILVAKRTRKCVDEPRVEASLATTVIGAGAGLLSGVSGVGGGVFVAPLLITLGIASARRTAGVSAPFILANSVVGFVGTFLAGQRVTSEVGWYAAAAMLGSIAGTTIGLRWMSDRSTRFVLAAILLVGGLRLLSR